MASEDKARGGPELPAGEFQITEERLDSRPANPLQSEGAAEGAGQRWGGRCSAHARAVLSG